MSVVVIESFGMELGEKILSVKLKNNNNNLDYLTEDTTYAGDFAAY